MAHLWHHHPVGAQQNTTETTETSGTKGRTLVLCFDGTNECYDAQNTNIVKLFSLLKKDDPSRQLVYYQAGVGTYIGPEIITRPARWVAMKVDLGIAYSLDSHVMAGYRYLQENWEGGDRICMFGFSRGAYTARALAGMLYTVGLLPKGMHEEVSFAYAIYRHEKASASYKNDFSRSNPSSHPFVSRSRQISISFLGAFDTVSAVGALIPRILPFSPGENRVTRVFRHAMSLDEKRAAFQVRGWGLDAGDDDDESDMTPASDAAGKDEEGDKEKEKGDVKIRTIAKEVTVKPDHHKPTNKKSTAKTKTAISSNTTTQTQAPNKGKGKQHVGVLRTGLAQLGLGLESLFVSSLHAAHGTIQAIRRVRVLPKETKGEKRAKERVVKTGGTGTWRRHTTCDVEVEAEAEASGGGGVVREEEEGFKTDVKEVYFAGCHTDIGGGSSPNGTRYALANIPLQWMIKEILLANDSTTLNGTGEAGPGILFNEDDLRFKELGIVLHPELEPGHAAESTTKDARREHLRDYVRLAHLTGHRDGPIGPSDSTVLPASTTSADPNPNSTSHPTFDKTITHDTSKNFNCGCDADTSSPSAYLPIDAREQDVLGPMHDKLSRSPAWWIVEFLPFVYSKQDANGVWRNSVRVNLFHGRTVGTPPPRSSSSNSRSVSDKIYPVLFHVSVRDRMQATPQQLRNAARAARARGDYRDGASAGILADEKEVEANGHEHQSGSTKFKRLTFRLGRDHAKDANEAENGTVTGAPDGNDVLREAKRYRKRGMYVPCATLEKGAEIVFVR